MAILVGPKPKVSSDAFEDLLGGHAFAKEKQPKTIKEMKREIEVLESDPQKLKVRFIYDIGSDRFYICIFQSLYHC